MSGNKGPPHVILESSMLEGLSMPAASSWVCFHQRQEHDRPGRQRAAGPSFQKLLADRGKAVHPGTSGQKFVQFSHLACGRKQSPVSRGLRTGEGLLPQSERQVIQGKARTIATQNFKMNHQRQGARQRKKYLLVRWPNRN